MNNITRRAERDHRVAFALAVGLVLAGFYLGLMFGWAVLQNEDPQPRAGTQAAN
jgi:hypothetical protein